MHCVELYPSGGREAIFPLFSTLWEALYKLCHLKLDSFHLQGTFTAIHYPTKPSITSNHKPASHIQLAAGSASMSSSSSSSSTPQKLQEQLPSPSEIKKDVEVAAKKSLQSLRDLVAGGVGGVCAVVVGHPFDLVKVRLQTAEKGVYTGAMDVVRKTIAREGPIRVSHTLRQPHQELQLMNEF
jgi:hypothetical protein